jgi:hypothetical protein
MNHHAQMKNGCLKGKVYERGMDGGEEKRRERGEAEGTGKGKGIK